MTKKILLLFAFVVPLLIMGAGCASSSTTTPVTAPTASTPGSSLTPTASPVTVVPTPSSDGTRALVATETDATWKLYTNKALGYTVNTPTRGKYAPDWEMKYVDQSDPHIINGCYFNHINPIPSNEAVSDNVAVLDGTKFCHTRSEDNESGSNFVVDDYATALGKKFIVIEFTKLIVDSNVVGCAGKMTEAYSLSETACIPFVASDYQTTLDGIVGTFQMNMVSNETLTYNGSPGPSDPTPNISQTDMTGWKTVITYPTNGSVIEGRTVKIKGTAKPNSYLWAMVTTEAPGDREADRNCLSGGFEGGDVLDQPIIQSDKQTDSNGNFEFTLDEPCSKNVWLYVASEDQGLGAVLYSTKGGWSGLCQSDSERISFTLSGELPATCNK